MLQRAAISYLSNAGGGFLGTPVQDYVFVDGYQLVQAGTAVFGHGDDEHSHSLTLDGAGLVFIDNVRVCREGEATSCGHVIEAGTPLIYIDD